MKKEQGKFSYNRSLTCLRHTLVSKYKLQSIYSTTTFLVFSPFFSVFFSFLFFFFDIHTKIKTLGNSPESSILSIRNSMRLGAPKWQLETRDSISSLWLFRSYWGLRLGPRRVNSQLEFLTAVKTIFFYKLLKNVTCHSYESSVLVHSVFLAVTFDSWQKNPVFFMRIAGPISLFSS